jgi:mono/diheme cytochrome c family protein
MKTVYAAAIIVLTIAGAVAAASGEATSVWDGIYTTEQAERGREAYARGCAECHGDGLEGLDPSPALTGSDFRWDWNELSVGDLYERVRISMPDGNPSSMTNAEKLDSIAYMLAKNGYPAGDVELPTRVSELRKFAILAVEP